MKESTFKLLVYRLNKIGYDFSDRRETLEKYFTKLIFTQESWSLQYIAALVGKRLCRDFKVELPNDLEIAYQGIRFLEMLPKNLVDYRVGYTPEGTPSIVIIPQYYFEEELEEKAIEPELDPEIEYSKKDLIHKRFWKGKIFDLDIDSLDILNNVAFTIDKNISILEDPSYDKSEHKHLEKSRSKELVDKYTNINKFYFRHFYDTRGRIYSRGYHINPQGTKYKKAMLTMINNTKWDQEDKDSLKDFLKN